jgi:tRNA-intron endonuclease
MDATLADDVVRAGQAAREQFHDSRGYGHPVDSGELALAHVEAAHLLYRGDLDSVDGMDFRAFLGSDAVSAVDFFVYKDLRDRGFYLSPAELPVATAGNRSPDSDGPTVDFIVYPRGKGPWDDQIQYRVRVVSERDPVAATALGDCVLAVVDEESEVSYFASGRPDIDGSPAHAFESVAGDCLADRVVCFDPPAALYEQAFYGQRLDDQGGGAVQLSLVEAAALARGGRLTVEGGFEALRGRGREVEGDRFDRRLRAYEALREAGMVPKTGFKFGADFRVYEGVDSVDQLGHSPLLVRVVPRDHRFEPRDLALDVRLAHGVKKTMVFALVADDAVSWRSLERLTP